jgi:hypothetical protein
MTKREGVEGEVEINIKKVRGYQWVNWFPRWRGFRFKRMELYSSWACIYDWSLQLGWFEVRKWASGKRIYRPPQ